MKFGDWLTLLFIYLKLTHQVDWNWFYVLCPIFISVVVGFMLNKIQVFLLKLSNLQKKT